MLLSPCRNTQTFALHPGLHSPSFSVLIGLTPVTNQRRYKSPGLSPCKPRSIVLSRLAFLSRLPLHITEYSDTQGSSSFTHGHYTGMDTTRILFRLKQGPRSLEQHICEFLAIANHSNLLDYLLIQIFCDGVNEPLKARLRREGPCLSLAAFMDYALLCVGSSFTVGIADEERDIPVMPAAQPAREMVAAPERIHIIVATMDPVHKMAVAPERVHTMVATAEPVHKMAATAVPVRKMAAAPVCAHKMAATAEPVHKMAAKTELCHVTAATPEPSKAKAVFPESSQVAAVFPESSRVTAGFPSQVKLQLCFLSQVKFPSPVKSRLLFQSQVKLQLLFLCQVKLELCFLRQSQPRFLSQARSQPWFLSLARSQPWFLSQARSPPWFLSQARSKPLFLSQAKSKPSFLSQVKSQLVSTNQVKSSLISMSQVTIDLHEPSQVIADLHEPSQVIADGPESSHVPPDGPESSHVSSDHPEPRHVSSDIPRSRPIMMASVLDPPLVSVRAANISVTPAPHRPTINEVLPPAAALPLMAVAIWCVWAAHCAPEVRSVHRPAPEVTSVHKSAPEVTSVHKSAPEVTSVHKSAAEVPSGLKSAAEVPSGLKSAPVVPSGLKSAPEIPSGLKSAPEASSAGEATPMPPEVSAPAKPPMVAALTYELSASLPILFAFSVPALPRSQFMTRPPALPWRAPAPPALLGGFLRLLLHSGGLLRFLLCLSHRVLCMDLVLQPSPCLALAPPLPWTVVQWERLEAALCGGWGGGYVMNLVGDLRSAHYQLSPCHNTQTVALHPGLHFPSFSALIGSAPVTNQQRYKSPGLSPCKPRTFSPGLLILSVSLPAYWTIARFTDYSLVSLPLRITFATDRPTPVSRTSIVPRPNISVCCCFDPACLTMYLSRPLNKSSQMDPLASRLSLSVTMLLVRHWKPQSQTCMQAVQDIGRLTLTWGITTSLGTP
ncbi:hypothetical protein H4Q32_016190 [Labeo rohita]|uniref:Uncharacterized protein n=1 Tax=Labeo rohita TaxID=84645 RepID=A0ABQ8LIP2_LABRO|nr:hypothetical protein H4Q32_016190 [Labeo rohita]